MCVHSQKLNAMRLQAYFEYYSKVVGIILQLPNCVNSHYQMMRGIDLFPGSSKSNKFCFVKITKQQHADMYLGL